MSSRHSTVQSAVIATDVVIMTVRDGGLQILLMKMQKAPYLKAWAIPGGRVHVDETVADAARRHLFLKTGVKDLYLEQLYTFGDVKRDPFDRVVSVAYFALVPPDDIRIDPKLPFRVEWFPIDRLPSLAYDHREIIVRALDRLRAKLEYTNIVYSLLPREFSLTELQRTYEVILGRKLDKRNLRKKILGLGLVRKTAKLQSGSANRPAALYTFVHRQPQTVSIL